MSKARLSESGEARLLNYSGLGSVRGLVLSGLVAFVEPVGPDEGNVGTIIINTEIIVSIYC